MLYQKLLMGKRPYYAVFSKMMGFEQHRHAELELIYNVSGSFNFIINKENYVLNPGDLAIVGSMTAHEVKCPAGSDSHALVIDVGPVFLSGYFDIISSLSISNPVLKLTDGKLKEYLDETVELFRNPPQFHDLMISGNLFRICACILDTVTSENTTSRTSKALRSVSNIEKALELISTDYSSAISIEYVAMLCGYSKSNFCKIFKNITGETFHNLLNQHRINIACTLLKETVLPVEAIALQTGFADAKIFCRVFKTIMGTSPGRYRKQ